MDYLNIGHAYRENKQHFIQKCIMMTWEGMLSLTNIIILKLIVSSVVKLTSYPFHYDWS